MNKFVQGQKVQYSTKRKENLKKRGFSEENINKQFTFVAADECVFSGEPIAIIDFEPTNTRYKLDFEDLEVV